MITKPEDSLESLIQIRGPHSACMHVYALWPSGLWLRHHKDDYYYNYGYYYSKFQSGGVPLGRWRERRRPAAHLGWNSEMEHEQAAMSRQQILQAPAKQAHPPLLVRLAMFL